jgi:hypothetical protein
MTRPRHYEEIEEFDGVHCIICGKALSAQALARIPLNLDSDEPLEEFTCSEQCGDTYNRLAEEFLEGEADSMWGDTDPEDRTLDYDD